MKNVTRWFGITTALIALSSVALAGEGPHAADKGAHRSTDELIKIALSGAPPHISKDAAVIVPGADGKMVEAKKGSNGFTCMPWVDTPDTPDPMCMDAAVGQWVGSLMNNEPKPSNTVPGIAYMGRGGQHWEKDGAVLMKTEPGAKAVKEPAHWMLMWPFDAKASGLATLPNPSGVWIMWAGTPYAHLMIEQDPAKIKP